MTNAPTILRSLAVYGLCLPLAVFLGYLLAMPLDRTGLFFIVVALALPLVPVLLRWHHRILIVTWNVGAVLVFVQGSPNLWIVMACLSLTLSILQHILNRNVKFAPVPSVARALIFLVVVILVTAKLTGGMGMRTFGGAAYGGKRYALVLSAIIGYFALSCHTVPRSQRITCTTLFLLGGLTAVVGSLGGYLDPSLNFIFTIFPVENLQAVTGGGLGPERAYERFGGLTQACVATVMFLLARHGARGLFNFREEWRFLPFRFRGGLAVNCPWRLVLFLLMFWTSLWAGGYRATLVTLALIFLFQAYLEGLHRTHVLPVLALVGILGGALCLPLANKLPLTVQRSISFLPVPIDPIARYDAETTTKWRLDMWRALLPEVPKYLLLGKGYYINPSELEMANAFGSDTGEEGSIIAGDFHNGPLSLIIPLGLCGVFAFLWFLAASLRVLYNNFRYGDPELQSINSFLLAAFITQTLVFFTVFGSFYSDLFRFTGLIGLSVSLNGGARSPEPVAAPKPAMSQLKLARAVP